MGQEERVFFKSASVSALAPLPITSDPDNAVFHAMLLGLSRLKPVKPKTNFAWFQKGFIYKLAHTKHVEQPM